MNVGAGEIRQVSKYVCHSRRVLKISQKYGWESGARYTNLRDVRGIKHLGFLDIDWKNYSFLSHIRAAKDYRPQITVAQDVLDRTDLPRILDEAFELSRYAAKVIVVPKDIKLSESLAEVIPSDFLLGYSVPTRYGGTEIESECFGQREVHLLGGRPDIQRRLADKLNVVSVDTNRFTLDASFGDYFDGTRFKPHPKGGYETCLRASLKNMNSLWASYVGPLTSKENCHEHLGSAR